MRILILSFYYEPDLSAGSFRNTALVKALSEKLTADNEIEVITTTPNRYQSFTPPKEKTEFQENVIVHRVPIHQHKSGLLDQALAFLDFVRGAYKLTRNKSYNLIYASSSRQMTAFLGAMMARRMNMPLYLDIRDIFTENINELYRRSPLRLLLPLLRYMERFSIRTASKVNLVSPFFEGYFKELDSTNKYSFHTNGVDQCLETASASEPISQQEYKEILYAGNIGKGQSLHLIIPDIARSLDPSWRIRIIGDGGGRKLLEESISGFDNVVLQSPVPRSQLSRYYSAATVLFLHLSDFPVLGQVIPSKIFEYAASGRPIIAGVRGKTAEFISESVKNSAIFKPLDANDFHEALKKIRLEHTPRVGFCEYYSRASIMDEMSSEILSIIMSQSYHPIDSPQNKLLSIRSK
jgi:glycosyltransferase involved in cell wall biosynthesis